MKLILCLKPTYEGDPIWLGVNDLYSYNPTGAKRFDSFAEIRDHLKKLGKYGIADSGYEMIIVGVDK